MRSRWIGALTAAALLSALPTCAAAAAPQDASKLPAPAATVVQKLFPGSSVTGVSQERESGVSYYEVTLRNGDETVAVEVTADGAVGEIERAVAMADLPAAARDAIEKATHGATLEEIEHHEVRGVAKQGTFAPLDPPMIVYECRYDDGSGSKELTVRADGKPARADDDDDESDEASDEELDNEEAGEDETDDES